MENSPYYRYSTYIKHKFGGRVQKINLDAGFTCPNRDGTKGRGGCTFCNNDSFGPPPQVTKLGIQNQIRQGIVKARRKYPRADKFFAYFQTYSNTYASLEHLKRLYETALAEDGVIGLCIATRPDVVDQEKLAYLRDLSSQVFISIEYGVESIFDATLERINRCHDYACTRDAINLTKEYGLHVCAHIILGFPWETLDDGVKTAEELSSLPIDSVKVHHLQVQKRSLLGEEYRRRPFKVLSRQDYFELLIPFLENLRGDISIERLFSRSLRQNLLAPHWEEGDVGTLYRLFDEAMSERGSFQGRLV